MQEYSRRLLFFNILLLSFLIVSCGTEVKNPSPDKVVHKDVTVVSSATSKATVVSSATPKSTVVSSVSPTGPAKTVVVPPASTPTTQNVPVSSAGGCGNCWHPPVVMTMQWQLTGTIDQSYNALLYDIDVFENSAAVVSSLHAAGRKVACYVNAGSWENWRSDSAQFPASVRGKNVDGWDGEWWLDIRQLATIGPLLQARMDLCQSKGFDAIEFDLVDGYANETGFPLTAQDQLTYNVWLATQAHQRGLSVALKNDLDQVQALVPYFDWALNEQCFQYDECDTLLPFVQAGKPVMVVEYDLETSQFCPQANALNLNAQKKKLGLDATRTLCR
jgi:hypothetical protein